MFKQHRKRRLHLCRGGSCCFACGNADHAARELGTVEWLERRATATVGEGFDAASRRLSCWPWDVAAVERTRWPPSNSDDPGSDWRSARASGSGRRCLESGMSTTCLLSLRSRSGFCCCRRCSLLGVRSSLALVPAECRPLFSLLFKLICLLSTIWLNLLKRFFII